METCKVISGSNLIDNAGGHWDVTLQLCTAILGGENVDAANVDQHYAEGLKDFRA